MSCEPTWNTYPCRDFYDDTFAGNFLEAAHSNQVLVLIRDSRNGDGSMYFDVAMYNSAFPELGGKRFSGDGIYFYFPFPYLVDVLGRRFEGYSEDVIDFLGEMELSLPDIMSLDTIQRAHGWSSVFGVLIAKASTSLPTLHSQEHQGLGRNVLLPGDGRCADAFGLVTSKSGLSCQLLGQTLAPFFDRGDQLCLLFTHTDDYDLLGGRLQFHEAMDGEMDSATPLCRGVVSGFIRETLEELGIAQSMVTARKIDDEGRHCVRVLKESLTVVLTLHWMESSGLFVVECSNN